MKSGVWRNISGKRIEEEAAQKTEYDNELKQVEKTEPELVNALQKSIARRSLLNKLQENGDNETLELYNDLIASAGDVVVKEEGNYEVTLVDNKFDLADLPEEKIKFVSGFGLDQLHLLLRAWAHS